MAEVRAAYPTMEAPRARSAAVRHVTRWAFLLDCGVTRYITLQRGAPRPKTIDCDCSQCKEKPKP